MVQHLTKHNLAYAAKAYILATDIYKTVHNLDFLDLMNNTDIF